MIFMSDSNGYFVPYCISFTFSMLPIQEIERNAKLKKFVPFFFSLCLKMQIFINGLNQ